MRIAHVSPYPMGRFGGVQTHIRDLADWMRGQGHEVMVIAPDATADGATTHPLGRTRDVLIHGTGFELSFAGPRALAAARAALRTAGVELLHLHTPWTPMMPWQLWRRAGLPGIATFHATLPDQVKPDLEARFIRRAARYFHQRLEALVVPSTAPQAQWARLGLEPLPTILPPTIDLSGWRAARAVAQQGPGITLVSLGRFEARKGIDTLLAAWPAMAAALPEARLIMAGAGPRPDLSALPPDAAARIALHPALPDDKARALVAGADLFIAPAPYGESFGLVLIEAMAAGTLPVAAANPGYATVLGQQADDLLFAPGDPAALATQVIALAEDAGKRAALRDWATAQADRYDVANVGPDYLRLYADVLRRAG